VSGLDGDEGAGTSDERNELGSMEELRKRGCWGRWTGQGLAPGGGGCSPDEPSTMKETAAALVPGGENREVRT
jgi:hypothetical protein